MHQSVEARLAAAGIQLVAETASHRLFARDNFIALVGRRTGSVGSTGMLTEQGLAYLIWRDGCAYVKSKSAEIPAAEEQVAAIRQFSRDLEAALSGAGF
jgi:hypothetical protein